MERKSSTPLGTLICEWSISSQTYTHCMKCLSALTHQIQHELTLVNLLEVVFFHKHACAAAAELLPELADYSIRKLTKLYNG